MSESGTTSDDWTGDEVAATVGDYLTMLQAEIRGERYSKSEHRRGLMPLLLPGRTEAAVEFKHRNISAVMLELGLPYIRGYRPARNYQGALAMEAQRRLATDTPLLAQLSEGPPPGLSGPLMPVARPTGASRTPAPRIVDFGALQAENRRLGARGEELVVEFERARLTGLGRFELAGQVRWVARDDGDGAGYDVLSFTEAGLQRFIEVKTTSLGADTPFYLSSAELAFAADHPDSYAIFRVFDVNETPRFFSIEGDLATKVELTPVTFRARLR